MLEQQTQVNTTVDDKVAGAVAPALSTKVEKNIDTGYRKYFDTEVKLGSRKVKIMLVNKFSILPKDPGAQFIRDEVTKKIGSTWKAGTRDIIRGLSKQEEEFYLPRLLGVKLDSEQWNDRVLQYWADFTVEIPNGAGKELEAGFKEVVIQGKKVVEPINIDDYIKFNFCKEHSSVATEPHQLDNISLYTYYMVDTQKEEEQREQEFTLRQEIDKAFIKLIQATDSASSLKIDWILETAGGENGSGMSIKGLTPIQKQMELEKLKNRNLSRFGEIVKDSHLQTKALIRRAIDVGALTQEGNSFFLDSKVIGSNLMQAVAHLEAPANNKDRLIVEERVKQY